MAKLAEAFIGGALLQSRILTPWIGWATILWKLAWLPALLIVGWVVGYISIVHHFVPFVIGIAFCGRTSICGVGRFFRSEAEISERMISA